MNPLEDDPDPTPDELAWWESGGHPAYKRVWRDGVDVTDLPFDQWPAYWRGEPIRSQRSGRRSSRRAGGFGYP